MEIPLRAGAPAGVLPPLTALASEGMERRAALGRPHLGVRARRQRALASRRSISRLFCPQDRASADEAERLSPLPSAGLSPRSPRSPSSHRRQSGRSAARTVTQGLPVHGRLSRAAGAAPCPAIKTPHERAPRWAGLGIYGYPFCACQAGKLHPLRATD
jgi:hypothetical protein